MVFTRQNHALSTPIYYTRVGFVYAHQVTSKGKVKIMGTIIASYTHVKYPPQATIFKMAHSDLCY